MFRRDYLHRHQMLFSGGASEQAGDEAWETSLGKVDFESLLLGKSRQPRPPQKLVRGAKQKGAGGRSGNSNDDRNQVNVLACVERGESGALVGYVLYELREKGPASRRQQYCELVNIVVREQSRGLGAGRLLFEALEADLAQHAAGHASDLRLYVAERNEAPLAWYKRLGFKEAGHQWETIGEEPIHFYRLAWRRPTSVAGDNSCHAAELGGC